MWNLSKRKMSEIFRGEGSSTAKLTKKDVIEIKKRLINNEHPKDIAIDYPVDWTQISAIKTGKHWSHVKVEGFKPARDEKYRQYKLTKEDVIEIKRLLAKEELTQARIAELYGVSIYTISDIKRGKVGEIPYHESEHSNYRSWPSRKTGQRLHGGIPAQKISRFSNYSLG